MKKMVFALILLLSTSQLSGCTVLGFGFGAMADAERTKLRGVPLENVATEAGKWHRVSLHLTDGRAVQGIVMDVATGEYIDLLPHKINPRRAEQTDWVRFEWVRIESVTKIERRKRGRITMMLIGIWLDMVVLGAAQG